jgi:predicted secreted protein
VAFAGTISDVAGAAGLRVTTPSSAADAPAAPITFQLIRFPE